MSEKVLRAIERDSKRPIAEKYVRDCLEIMDGSAEAGIQRIGLEQFKRTIEEVLDTLPGQSRCQRRKVRR
jgi:hypothetical protein